jgi:hypothetical protein
MNYKKHFLKTNNVGFVLGAALVVTLAGYADNANAQGVRIIVQAPVILSPPVLVVAPPVAVSPVVVEDDYVYYPGYEVYYNSSRHQYAHLEGGAWVWAPAPNGVSLDVLLASPSVHMDFHDSLEKHHAEMLQRYPRDWQPAGERHDMMEDRKDAGPGHDRKPPE